MNQISEWSGYDKPESVFIFKIDGVWLNGFISVVASNEHLARSLLCIHVNNMDDGTKASYGKDLPPLVAVLPVDKTCAVTVWNGDY